MTRTRRKSSISPSTTNSAEYGTKEYDNEFYGKFLQCSSKTTDQESKEIVLNYLKNNNKPYHNLETLHSKNFKPLGLYIKLEQEGIKLPQTEKDLLESGILNFTRLDTKRGIELNQIKKNKSIQEKYMIQKTVSSMLNSLDNQVVLIQSNQKPYFDFKTFIGGLSLGLVKLIEIEMKDILDKNIKELRLAKNKKDPQLVEAYSYLTPKQLKILLEFSEDLMNRLQTGLVIKSRKPRTQKPKSVDKLVKKIKYMQSFSELGLKSVNPTEIIGANIVYIYNTKTRFLERFESDIGMSVKGSTLIQIKEPAVKKKIRNPDALKNINITNKNFMERFWTSFKTKQGTANSRINSNCIILSCLNNKNES